MSDIQIIETTPAATAQPHEGEVRAAYDVSRWRAPSHRSRRAAAVEAAYILEAVSK